MKLATAYAFLFSSCGFLQSFANAKPPGADVCGEFQGKAKGICTAFFAQDCITKGPSDRKCAKKDAKFEGVTGFSLFDLLSPSGSPSSQPSMAPSSMAPSSAPSMAPTSAPSMAPSLVPVTCTGAVSDTTLGAVTVEAGQSCFLLNVTVNGPVTCEDGASFLVISDSVVKGRVELPDLGKATLTRTTFEKGVAGKVKTWLLARDLVVANEFEVAWLNDAGNQFFNIEDCQVGQLILKDSTAVTNGSILITRTNVTDSMEIKNNRAKDIRLFDTTMLNPNSVITIENNIVDGLLSPVRVTGAKTIIYKGNQRLVPGSSPTGFESCKAFDSIIIEDNDFNRGLRLRKNCVGGTIQLFNNSGQVAICQGNDEMVTDLTNCPEGNAVLTTQSGNMFDSYVSQCSPSS